MSDISDIFNHPTALDIGIAFTGMVIVGANYGEYNIAYYWMTQHPKNPEQFRINRKFEKRTSPLDTLYYYVTIPGRELAYHDFVRKNK